jgi:hypothetical protein
MGRVGEDPAHPMTTCLELTAPLAGAPTATVRHDRQAGHHLAEMLTPRLRVTSESQFDVNGTVARAEATVLLREGDVERLLRTMRFDAGNDAAPELMPDIRYACWLYHPVDGDPDEQGLLARLLLKEGGSGYLRRYQALTTSWREDVVQVGL